MDDKYIWSAYGQVYHDARLTSHGYWSACHLLGRASNSAFVGDEPPEGLRRCAQCWKDIPMDRHGPGRLARLRKVGKGVSKLWEVWRQTGDMPDELVEAMNETLAAYDELKPGDLTSKHR